MPRTKKPRATRTAFVPRSILSAAFAGVIPAIAASQAGCGATVTPADASDAADTPNPPNDQQVIALAMIGFDAEAGTDAADVTPPDDGPQVIVLAMIGFDAEAGTDATDEPDTGGFSVADVGFGPG